jgi:hypothetical protein
MLTSESQVLNLQHSRNLVILSGELVTMDELPAKRLL